jgi:hypothetical protein
MAIDADAVRELAARHEGPSLNFSINSTITRLAELYPFDRDKYVTEHHPIKIGEDAFTFAFYGLLELLIRFEEAMQLD